MTPEMKESLTEIARALEKLNRTMDAEIPEIERSGATPAKIEHVRAGIKAIKDCGNMLLIWADYIARGDLVDPKNPELEQDLHPR